MNQIGKYKYVAQLVKLNYIGTHVASYLQL